MHCGDENLSKTAEGRPVLFHAVTRFTYPCHQTSREDISGIAERILILPPESGVNLRYTNRKTVFNPLSLDQCCVAGSGFPLIAKELSPGEASFIGMAATRRAQS